MSEIVSPEMAVAAERTVPLTASERKDLLQLIRARERVAKTGAAERAAQLRADFETQLDTRYSFDTNETWAAAYKLVRAAQQTAQEQVHIECERLGIPRAFAPWIMPPHWVSRNENLLKERRTELRRLAHMHIDANEKSACAEIAKRSVAAQTTLFANGLSDAGLAFLERPPTADAMIPALTVAEVEKLLPGRGAQ